MSFAKLWSAGLGIGIFVMIVALTGLMIGEVQDQTTANTAEYNVTVKGLEGLEILGDWTPLIAIAVVMIVIIGLILRELGGVRD